MPNFKQLSLGSDALRYGAPVNPWLATVDGDCPFSAPRLVGLKSLFLWNYLVLPHLSGITPGIC